MEYFWAGFYKRADADIGGSGFTGIGKGNLPTGYAEQGRLQGKIESEGVRESTQFRDKNREPEDLDFGNTLKGGPAASNPHIIY